MNEKANSTQILATILLVATLLLSISEPGQNFLAMTGLSVLNVEMNLSLSTATGRNLTSEDLTVTIQANNPDSDVLINITDWRINDTSIAVLNMPFEANNGSNATDYSTYGNNGTVYGGEWCGSCGYHNTGAYNLSGASSYINLSNDVDFNFSSNSFSISLWMKVNSFDSAWDAIITKGNSSWGIQRYRETSNISFSTVGLSNEVMMADTEIVNGEWYFVVAVYNGTVKSLYVNGELDINETVTGTISTNDYSVLIGENEELAGKYLNGTIDRVVIFNRALSPQEITNLYTDSTIFTSSTASRIFGKASFTSAYNSCPVHPCAPVAVSFDSSDIMVMSTCGYFSNQYAKVWFFNDSLNDQSASFNLTYQFGQAGQSVFDASGNLVIMDHTWNRVLVFNPPFHTASPNVEKFFGQKNLFETAYHSIVPYRAFHISGVHVDKTKSPDAIYVVDNGNNRILGFNSTGYCSVADTTECTVDSDCPAEETCTNLAYKNATVVIGQSDMYSGTCNGDNTLDLNPNTTTICLVGSGGGEISPAEASISYSIATDSSGNLYVPDGHNNRVLKYNDPFTTDSVADDIWGQEDYTSKDCNKGSTADNTTICFSPDSYDHAGATTDIDSNGNLWVTDLANSRVMRYNLSSDAPHEADLVLGQEDFETSTQTCTNATPIDKFCRPVTVRINASGHIYVVDQHIEGRGEGYSRVMRFSPPFTNGMDADIIFANESESIFGRPEGITFDPSDQGVWVVRRGESAVLYDSSGNNISTMTAGVGEMSTDNASNFYYGGNTPSSWHVTRTPDSANLLYSGWNEVDGATALGDPYALEVYGDDQIFMASDRRLLVIDDFHTKANGSDADYILGWPSFTNDTDSIFGDGGVYDMFVDDVDHLWVASYAGIFVYDLPITESGEQPLINFSRTTSFKWNDDNTYVSFSPKGIAYDSADDVLWIADYTRIIRVKNPLTNGKADLVIGQTTKGGSSCAGSPTAGNVCYGNDLTIDSNGKLYVVDGVYEMAGRVLEFDKSDFLTSGLTSVMASEELTNGENWTACITQDDGTQHGTTVCSNTITVSNLSSIVVTGVGIESTYGTDKDGENLTLTWVSRSNFEESVINITDWRIGGESIMLLNMPFEGGSSTAFTKDYSTHENNGTVSGAAWDSDGGYDGKGAYYFDSGDMILLDDSLPDSGETTLMAWVNYTGGTSWGTIFSDDIFASEAYYNLLITESEVVHVNVKKGETYFDFNVAHDFGNTWHHIAWTMDSTASNIYIDGILSATGGGGSNIGLHATNPRIGTRGDGSAAYVGYIDELKLFNISLSAEQVMNIYRNESHIMSSDDTKVGEVWTACVTPNDGTEDGTTVCSNEITILEGDAAPPNNVPAVSGVSVNSTFATNLTTENLTVYWTSTDADGNAVINITDWRMNNTSIALLNYPFENHSAAGTYAIDYSTNKLNATVSNGAVFMPTSGHDGHGAYQFDGSDDFIYLDLNYDIAASPRVSFFMWLNYTDNATQKGAFQLAQEETSGAPCVLISIPDSLLSFFVDGGYRDQTTILPVGQWSFVGLTYDGTDWKFYKEGVLTSTYTGGTSGCDAGLEDLYIGDGWANNYIGFIDDFIMFNRTLSQEQILWLNSSRHEFISSNETSIGENWTACVTPNDGLADGTTVCSNTLTISESAADTTSPVISDLINISISNESAVINFTTDESANASINYGITVALGTTIANATTLSNHNQNITGLLNYTTYYYNITSCDSSGNCNLSGPWNFITSQNAADSISPYFNETPTNQVLEYGTALHYQINATDEGGFNNYFVNDTTNFAIDSSNGSLTNNTLLYVGTFWINITLNDTAGNQNSSVISITVQDTAEPGIIFNSPANNTVSTSSSVNLSVNITDNYNITNATIYIYNETGLYNQSFFVVSGISSMISSLIDFVDGIYTWFAGIFDSSGNYNVTDNRTLTIDTTAPVVSSVSNYSISNSSIVINWTTGEVSNSTVNYGTTTALGNNNLSSSYSFSRAINITSLTNATTYYYNITSCDQYEHCIANGTFNFTTLQNAFVDLVSPVSAIITPSNNSVDVDGIVYFNASATDETGLQNASIYLDGTLNKTNTISGTSNTTSFNISGLSDGIYSWYVLVYDNSSNSVQTAIRRIIVNTSVVPTSANFTSGNSTNWSAVQDITNVCNGTAVLDNPNTSQVTWLDCVNAEGANFDVYVVLANNNVTIISSGLNSTFNSTARITIRNLTWSSTPTILRDGQTCPATICSDIHYTAATGILTFNVTGFSSYTTAATVAAGTTTTTTGSGSSRVTSSGILDTFAITKTGSAVQEKEIEETVEATEEPVLESPAQVKEEKQVPQKSERNSVNDLMSFAKSYALYFALVVVVSVLVFGMLVHRKKTLGAAKITAAEKEGELLSMIASIKEMMSANMKYDAVVQYNQFAAAYNSSSIEVKEKLKDLAQSLRTEMEEKTK